MRSGGECRLNTRYPSWYDCGLHCKIKVKQRKIINPNRTGLICRWWFTSNIRSTWAIWPWENPYLERHPHILARAFCFLKIWESDKEQAPTEGRENEAVYGNKNYFWRNTADNTTEGRLRTRSREGNSDGWKTEGKVEEKQTHKLRLQRHALIWAGSLRANTSRS